MTTVFEITEHILYDGGELLPHTIKLKVCSSYDFAFEYMYKMMIEDMNKHIKYHEYYDDNEDDEDDNEDDEDDNKKNNKYYNTTDVIDSFFDKYDTTEKIKKLKVFDFGYQCYISNYDKPKCHETKWLYILMEGDLLNFNFPRAVCRNGESYHFDKYFQKMKSLPNINKFIKDFANN